MKNKGSVPKNMFPLQKVDQQNILLQVRLFTPTGSLTFKRAVPKFLTHQLGGGSLGDAKAPMPGVVEKAGTALQLLRTSFFSN
jgi:hypothetical protein